MAGDDSGDVSLFEARDGGEGDAGFVFFGEVAAAEAAVCPEVEGE